mmetsp:Transcript_98087/g.274574  ORF Transcript_98087/g.274574 Transcript_98087/m.274574 type:complete len:285 (-) Transcript_98087:217-1071(-)
MQRIWLPKGDAGPNPRRRTSPRTPETSRRKTPWVIVPAERKRPTSWLAPRCACAGASSPLRRRALGVVRLVSPATPLAAPGAARPESELLRLLHHGRLRQRPQGLLLLVRGRLHPHRGQHIGRAPDVRHVDAAAAERASQRRRSRAAALLPAAVVEELDPTIGAESVAGDIMHGAVPAVWWNKCVHLVLEADHALLCSSPHEVQRCRGARCKPAVVMGGSACSHGRVFNIVEVFHKQVAFVDSHKGPFVLVVATVPAYITGEVVVGGYGRLWSLLAHHCRESWV